MVQKKLPLINSAHGSETRNIINELIKLFNGMGYTYDEALQKSLVILKEAQKTNDMNEEVQRQLNNIILENGNSEAEVVQARGDNDVLNERLNKADKTDTLLENRSFYSESNSHKHRKAMISIVDDDGRTDVYEKLKPIAEQYNIPITSAIVTSRVDNNAGTMTSEQLKELSEIGFEFVSHGVNHKLLTSISDEEKDYELRESSKWLNERGYNGRVHVYVGGSQDEASRMIARKYYRASINIDNGQSHLNYPPLKTHNLERVYIDNGVANAKSKIDKTLETGSWMILGMHCFYPTWSAAEVKEVIEYAMAKGLEFVTVDEAINVIGNVLDVGDISVGNEGAVIDADHNFHGNLIGTSRYLDSSFTSNITSATPVTEFQKRTISFGYLLGYTANVGDFPEKAAGTLQVFRMANDLYSFRIYHVSGSPRTYKSAWNNATDAWDPWERIDIQHGLKTVTLTTSGGIAAHTTKDIDVYSGGYTSDATLVAMPTGGIENGLIYNVFLLEEGRAKLRISNITDSAITPVDREWKIKVIY